MVMFPILNIPNKWPVQGKIDASHFNGIFSNSETEHSLFQKLMVQWENSVISITYKFIRKKCQIDSILGF